MEKREFKDRVFGELARVTNALGNSRRLEVIDLLAQGEKTVEKISSATGMSIANASQHLQILKRATLVDTRRDGNFIFYKISDDNVVLIWNLIRELGTQRIADIDKVVKEYRTARNVFESVTIEQLVSKLEYGNIILIDVRPEEEFASGHIKGALSVPIENLKESLKNFHQDKEIIAYCRGAFCVFADEAVEFLKKNKFKATRLEEGFPEWKLKGLPIEN